MVTIFVALIACAYSIIYFVRDLNKRKAIQKATHPDFMTHVAKKFVVGSRTVLVVGGNHMLGKRIVTMFKAKKMNVVVFDSCIPAEDARDDAVSYVQGSLFEDTHLIAALFLTHKNSTKKGVSNEEGAVVDSVVHAGHLYPTVGLPDEALWDINVKGTQKLIDLCVQYNIKTFIHSSSVNAVLVECDKSVMKATEEGSFERRMALSRDFASLNHYTDSLLTAEDVVIHATRASSRNEGGTVSCTLRPGIMFGDDDDCWAQWCLKTARNVYFGNGDAHLEFIPVENAALAHVLAESVLSGDQGEAKRKRMVLETYFVCNGEHYTYGWFLGQNGAGDDELDEDENRNDKAALSSLQESEVKEVSADTTAGVDSNGARKRKSKKNTAADKKPNGTGVGPSPPPPHVAPSSTVQSMNGPPVSHWGHAPPEHFSVGLAYFIIYLNNMWHSITGGSFLPLWWTATHVELSQITLTCCTDKALEHFDFRPVLTVDDTVKRIAKSRITKT